MISATLRNCFASASELPPNFTTLLIPEFKKKIVDIHEKDRRTYKSIADEYGVSKASISKWCSEFNKEYQRNLQIMENNDLMKENARLKQENRKLRKKIAFLKETTIFLAKEMN